MTQLADKIRAYIAKCTLTKDVWVTKEQILTSAQKTGLSAIDIMNALRVVHSMGDVEVRATSTTITYRIRRMKQARVTPVRVLIPEPDLDPLSCAFFTDAERACLAIPYRERSDECHELCDTPAGFDVYMTRKYGGPKWKRMKEERAYIT